MSLALIIFENITYLFIYAFHSTWLHNIIIALFIKVHIQCTLSKLARLIFLANFDVAKRAARVSW